MVLSGGGVGNQLQEADERERGAPSGSGGADLHHSAGGNPQTASPEPGAPTQGTNWSKYGPRSLIHLVSGLSDEAVVFQLSELQVQSLEVQNLTQDQQNLKTKLNELETARTQAEEQVRTTANNHLIQRAEIRVSDFNLYSCVQAARADTALSLVQAQHVRQLQQLQERAGDGCREQVEELQARLGEEQQRSQQLEETLRLQAQQSCSQISMKQVDDC